MAKTIYDIIIVGAGPAGLTSAIYARRAGKSVLILEKESIGGQIATSPKVENYPSIMSISGTELMDKMMTQATELGADFDIDEVKHIEKNDGLFQLTGEYGNYVAKSVILATGCSHRSIKAPGVEELLGNGISYCAVCDGSFYQNQDVCLIGDANTALQYALMLSNICHKVFVCTLFDKFFGEDILVQALLKRDNVEITHNLLLKEVLGTDEVESVVFEDTKTKEIKRFWVKGLFIAIGQIPHNENFTNVVDLDQDGYIIASDDCFTKTEGLYVAGDCRKKALRQVATAIGDAALAATQAVKYLDQGK